MFCFVSISFAENISLKNVQAALTKQSVFKINLLSLAAFNFDEIKRAITRHGRFFTQHLTGNQSKLYSVLLPGWELIFIHVGERRLDLFKLFWQCHPDLQAM